MQWLYCHESHFLVIRYMFGFVFIATDDLEIKLYLRY